MVDHEAELIRSFFVASKQKRLTSLLANPKRRRTALNTLYHCRDLNTRYVIRLSSDAHTPNQIAEALQRLGAPSTCWVVSTATVLDACELPLLMALKAIIGSGEGNLVSCVPGKLAYFEGEEAGDRCILHRPTKTKPEIDR